MQTIIDISGKRWSCDLGQPIDISLALGNDRKVNCFYAPPFKSEAVVAGNFIGSTQAGGPVNFKNLFINPHGNGTHTECVGHISKEVYHINDCLTQFHHLAKVVSVPLVESNGDKILSHDMVTAAIQPDEVKALVIRTMPNADIKMAAQYSGMNPPYVLKKTMDYIVQCGIEHLLIDLPSVDREEDGGALAAHKAFWKYPDQPRTMATITELIYVRESIKDGFYLLNLQIASLEVDASPSKPVLYLVTPV